MNEQDMLPYTRPDVAFGMAVQVDPVGSQHGKVDRSETDEGTPRPEPR
jgi:hypothetical protein